MSVIIITICLVVIAVVGIFGVFYSPGYPWMDRPRKIALVLLCIAGVVGLVTIILSHV